MRAPGRAAKSSEREEDERDHSPCRLHRRQRQQMIGTLRHGDHNNQPIFGGWRRDAVATIAVATIARAMIARWARRRAPGSAAESSKHEEDKRIFPPRRSHEATAVNKRCEGRTQQSAYFWRLETRRRNDREDNNCKDVERNKRRLREQRSRERQSRARRSQGQWPRQATVMPIATIAITAIARATQKKAARKQAA
jgi:hypothetical protein